MKRVSLLLGLGTLFLLSALAGGGITTTNPDATRYDDVRGTWAITYNFTSSGDSTLWIGFEATTATVLRMNANVQVTPVFAPKTIQDPSLSSRAVANPRAGMAAFAWGPDTLTTTFPEWDFCCSKLLGIRVKALGTAGYVKIYVDGAK